MVFKQKQAEKPFYRRHGYLLSIHIAESYVEANTWEERKRLGKALDAALARVSAAQKREAA